MSAHFPFCCALFMMHAANITENLTLLAPLPKQPKWQKTQKWKRNSPVTYFLSSALHRFAGLLCIFRFGPVWFHLMHFTVSVFGAIVFSVQLFSPSGGTGFLVFFNESISSMSSTLSRLQIVYNETLNFIELAWKDVFYECSLMKWKLRRLDWKYREEVDVYFDGGFCRSKRKKINYEWVWKI